MKAEAASDTLVALSRNHFSLVMYELQHHLKPLNLTDEFVIVTLAKLANGNGASLRVLSPRFWLPGLPPGLCLSLPLSWPPPLPFLSFPIFLWHSLFSSLCVSLGC